MNILVIATHHGAFLTLESLRKFGDNNVKVVVPQSQIEKYKTFDGDIFKNFKQNLKAACPFGSLYESSDWSQDNKLRSAYNFIHTIGGSGLWVVLEAGSLLVGESFPEFDTRFAVVKARVHPKMAKLYKMLGKDEVSDAISINSFFVNMESTDSRMMFVDSHYIHRPDVLYPMSFGMLECLRYQNRIKEATTANFWMESIRGKQEQGEWVAYPYDLYAELAEKVKDLIPKQSYENIMANGDSTNWLQDLVALDL